MLCFSLHQERLGTLSNYQHVFHAYICIFVGCKMNKIKMKQKRNKREIKRNKIKKKRNEKK